MDDAQDFISCPLSFTCETQTKWNPTFEVQITEILKGRACKIKRMEERNKRNERNEIAYTFQIIFILLVKFTIFPVSYSCSLPISINRDCPTYVPCFESKLRRRDKNFSFLVVCLL